MEGGSGKGKREGGRGIGRWREGGRKRDGGRERDGGRKRDGGRRDGGRKRDGGRRDGGRKRDGGRRGRGGRDKCKGADIRHEEERQMPHLVLCSKGVASQRREGWP